MTVEFSPTITLVDTEDAAGKDDLWQASAHFLAQWIDSVGLRSSWSTAVGGARSLAQKRMGLVDRPYRTLSVDLLGLERRDMAGLESMMMRRASARSRVPLYCDATALDEDVSTGATSLVCDTTNRRFFEGGYALIIQPWKTGSRMLYGESVRIDAVSASGLTLVVALGNDYRKNAKVYPIIEADLIHESGLRLITSTVGEGTLEFIETPGPSALPPLIEPGAASADPGSDNEAFLASVTMHGGYPIFDFMGSVAWGEIEKTVRRSGDRVGSGRGFVTSIYGDRPYIELTLPMLFMGRELAFRMLRFFDWRGGMLLPFWLIEPEETMEVVSVGATSAEVKPDAPEFDWTFRPYVGFTYADGRQAVREVMGVVRAGEVDTLSWSGALDDPSEVVSITWAHLMQFSSDELAERWITDEHMAADLGVVELIEEKAVTIANLESPATETADLTRFQQTPSCCEDEVECAGERDYHYWRHTEAGDARRYIGGMMTGAPLITWSGFTGNGRIAMPMVVAQDITITTLEIEALAAAEGRLGIYASVDDGAGNLYPGALILDAGLFEVLSAQVVPLTFDPVDLAAGLYWLVIWHDGGVYQAIRNDAILGPIGTGTTFVSPPLFWRLDHPFNPLEELPEEFPPDAELEQRDRTVAIGVM